MSAWEGIGTLVGTLTRASIEGGLFVAGVWIVCRLFPRLPASLRCGLWWAACLKLLLGLVPLPAVRLPLLPAAMRVAPVADAQPLSIRTVGGAPGRTLTPAPSRRPFTSSLTGRKRSCRETAGAAALVVLWIAGLLILCRKAFRELRHTRWIVRSSEPIREGWVRTAFAEICERLGFRRAPDLRGSGEVRTPQVTGLAQPVVLIPRSGFERLTPAEVSMTLCHELVHLRRRDLWLGWVPALAHRIFFFHPLAALAVREYAIAREAACDAEVLRILGSAPQAYGRLLLRWGVAPRETGLAAAGASPSLQNLKRRLQMLHQNDNKRRFSGWWWLAGAAVLAGLAPLQIVAQDRAPEGNARSRGRGSSGTGGGPGGREPVEAPEAAEAPVAPTQRVPVPGGPRAGSPRGSAGSGHTAAGPRASRGGPAGADPAAGSGPHAARGRRSPPRHTIQRLPLFRPCGGRRAAPRSGSAADGHAGRSGYAGSGSEPRAAGAGVPAGRRGPRPSRAAPGPQAAGCSPALGVLVPAWRRRFLRAALRRQLGDHERLERRSEESQADARQLGGGHPLVPPGQQGVRGPRRRPSQAGQGPLQGPGGARRPPG